MSTEEMIQQEMFESATSPEPAAEQPSEQPAVEQQAPEPQPQGQRVDPATGDAIPSWRLREESEARRNAENRARQLEERLEQINTHFQQQQRNRGQQAPPDFFENPHAAVQAAVQQYIQPLAAQQREANLYLGRKYAEMAYGAENVALAEKVFMEARDKRALDPMDYERVVRSPNRYEAVVDWYKRMYALHTVGEDPNAWWQKQFDTKLADPKFQAEVMEKIRGSAATRPGTTNLPPTLSRSTAAAGNGVGSLGDLSHDSLWANAMK